MPDSSGMVLVVDDDEDWLETITDFLAEEGYSVVAVPDAASALETLLRLQPFAVVTDLEMPSMDGRQLLAGIHERDAHVPVIVVTGTHRRDVDPSLESAFRVIRKPVPVEDLLSALTAARAYRAAHLPLRRLWSVAIRSRVDMRRLRLSATGRRDRHCRRFVGCPLQVSPARRQTGGLMNAVDLLASQHRQMEKILSRLETTTMRRHKEMLLAALADDLSTHVLIGEHQFYPAV